MNQSIVPEPPVEGLHRHVFLDTGRWVWIRKVTPGVAIELRRKFPAPRPPKQLVNYGGDLGEGWEINESDPDYLAAYQDHETELENKLRRMYIRRGVVIPGEFVEQGKEEVEAFKAEWKEETGDDLEGSWEFLYVSFICIGSDKDLEELLEAITRRSFRNGEGHPDSDPGAEAEVQG